MTLKIGDTYSFTGDGRTAKATVGVIGESAETEIVCLYVFDAHDFADDNARAQGFSGVIAHVPLRSDFAVQGMGEKLAENAPIPDTFTESHAIWKENLARGHVGWYEMPLPQVLDHIFSTVMTDGPEA